jgi:hypothetical protein
MIIGIPGRSIGALQARQAAASRQTPATHAAAADRGEFHALHAATSSIRCVAL